MEVKCRQMQLLLCSTNALKRWFDLRKMNAVNKELVDRFFAGAKPKDVIDLDLITA